MYGRCQRTGCGELFEIQSGPGRPRRFCSAACRRADKRPEPQPEPGASRSYKRFSARLDAAIEQSKLTLGEICDRLRNEDEVELAPSTLSNWRNGHVPQRRPDRDARLHALERVLGLNRGALLFTLDAPSSEDPGPVASSAAPSEHLLQLRARAGRLGGVDGYLTTRVCERFVIKPDRRQHFRQVQQTVLATEDDTDCYWLFVSADRPDAIVKLAGLDRCRLGRRVQDGALLAAELLFDTVLRRGEDHTFGFALVLPEETEPVRRVRRWTSPPGQPALDYFELLVTFKAPPRRVWECHWPTEDEPPVDLRPVSVVDGTAQLAMEHPTPGLFGLRWEW